MGIFDASISSGGSANSAQNYAYNNSRSAMQTYAPAAIAASVSAADLAFARQQQLMQAQMDFNREEAQKQRDWESEMANTIYTRSVKNMREAGINPILAAGMGLSGASVGSGATASISGASAPMAQSFMDTSSASSGGGESFGESHGSSWSDSESGLVTALSMMGGYFTQLADSLNLGEGIENATEAVINYLNDSKDGKNNTLPEKMQRGIFYNPIKNSSKAAAEAVLKAFRKNQ